MAKQPKTENPLIKQLSKRIKDLRIVKGYSNYENFAYDHGISRAQYGRYEKGEDLRFTSLMKLIEAFEMTPEEFFSEGFDSKSKKKNTK
ncbi:MAG: helix-turn-helix domain-containing protein [Bacteroidia bacterium]|nr:helix-turn-helix domain-containing protein [Bacteroidia bacterium]